jgi:hypothetical protein
MKLRMICLLALLHSPAYGDQILEKDDLKGTAFKHDPFYENSNASLSSDVVEDAPIVKISADTTSSQGRGILRLSPEVELPKEPSLSWWEECCAWVVGFFK